ncbi:MAG: hypothetical protein PHP42_10645 [Bacteroidota bacterium]|nr:hypothetical protein [Bacteroidota bacterium]
MKKYTLHLVSVTLAFFSLHCGITQPVRVLPENETRVASSLGGPIIPLGNIAIVVPYLNGGVQYGYRENMTLFGNVHATALLFKDLGVDGGFAVRMVKENGIRPEVTLKGQIYFFWDFIRSNNKRLFPMATLNASYTVGEQSLIYFGGDNLFQLNMPDYLFSPFVGYKFGVSDMMQMQVETKWLAVNKNTRHGVFEGTTSIAGKGNIGAYVGWEMTLK